MPSPERAGQPMPVMPADAIWLFEGDLILGNRLIVAKAESAGGLGAALKHAFADQPTPQQLDLIRAAARRSSYGENAVANMQLAFAGLSRVNVHQARDTRDLESDPLGKYDPNQPRVPAGSGSESGRWTDGEEAAPDQDSATPGSAQVIRVTTCSQYIAENCQGRILREFPAQFLDMNLEDLLAAARNGDAAARKAKKLLFDKRFQKP